VLHLPQADLLAIRVHEHESDERAEHVWGLTWGTGLVKLKSK
jgi:hypothetical protein